MELRNPYCRPLRSKLASQMVPVVAAPSSLVRLVDQVHRERFGTAMTVRALHAGLECGIIGEKYPGMEMVSFGPTLSDAHTPDERVHVPSVATFWKLLVGTLDRISAPMGA